MNNSDRLRFLTSNYFALQGLRFTPLWLFLVFRPWFDVVPNHRPFYLRDWLTLAMLLLCGAWIWLAGNLYHRRYGTVKAKSWPWWHTLCFVAVIAAYFACYQADYKNPPLSFAALWWSCVLAARAVWQSGSESRRFAYSLSGICMLVLATVPLAGRISSSQLLNAYHPSGAVLLGVLMVTLGILDHLELVRLISLQSQSAHG